MILTALDQLYHRLLANPDANSGRPRVPAYGFTEERIGHILTLSRSGDLIDVIQNSTLDGNKVISDLATVPWSFDRTGVFTEKAFEAGKTPAFFLWDKPEYLLGLSLKDKKLESVEICDLQFRAFQRLHCGWFAETQDEGLLSVMAFLNKWVPEAFGQSKILPKMLETNFSFKLDGDTGLICHRPAAIEIWRTHVQSAQCSMPVPCLVSNKMSPIKVTHAKIKGVWGGQSSGASIVSFNEDAYASYGKSQGENAPVSEASAFAYTTALNYLLRRDNGQCLAIGDTSTVFWAVSAEGEEAAEAESLFSFMLSMPSDDTQEQAKIKPLLQKIALGKKLDEIAPDLAKDTRFYVLGLASNRARISIRYWMDTSFEELDRNLKQHASDLSLGEGGTTFFPSVHQLLMQLVPHRKRKDGKEIEWDRKLIPNQIAGEMLGAILSGRRYPRSMLTTLVLRIRADGDVNGLRVALIKAVLVRDHRKSAFTEDIPMALDEKNVQPAYRLGRLFAVLERIQQGALGKDVNATIADRYYGTASAVPYSVFPRLLSGSKNHLSKIRKEKPGFAVNLEKELGSVMDGLESNFPKHFSIEQQGQFAIGYYHQKQRFFAKNDLSELNHNADAKPAPEAETPV